MTTSPLESEADARNLPGVRAVREVTGYGQDWRDRRAAAERAITADACTYARITPGAYEARFLDWIAGWEPEMGGAAGNLIRRAYEAGRAGRDAAVKLLEEALHLHMNGERAPGGTETWPDWDRRAEAYLRKRLDEMAEAEAWGGRGPSASYAEWLAEGRQEGGSETPPVLPW